MFETVTGFWIFYYIYAYLKFLWTRSGRELGSVAHLLIGSASGVLNITATLPLELLTTRPPHPE